MTDGDRGRWWMFFARKQFLWLVAGLMGGVAVAGGLALLLHYWIEPIDSPVTWGSVRYDGGENFELWYAEDSPAAEDRSDFVDQLEAELADLLELLDPPADSIPYPITVFVHDSVPAMKSAILRRKSPNTTAAFGAAFDMLASEDPRGPLAEVVLAHGWGDCFAQAIYVGMLLYARNPEQNFHLAVRAAPEEMRHSISELAEIEKNGIIQTTLHQRVNAPTAPRFIIGLGDVADLLSLNIQEVGRPGDLISLEAASLVQYLIDLPNGLDRLKAAWGPGRLPTLLGRFETSLSIDEVGEQWRSVALATDVTDPGYPYMRAYYLFESGRLAEAHEAVMSWGAAALESDNLAALACRASLAVGDAASAQRFAAQLPEEHAVYQQLAADMAGWSLVEGQRVTLIGSGSAQELAASLAEIEAVVDGLFAMADPAREEERVVVLIHPDEASRELGEILLPSQEAYRSMAHLVKGEVIAFRLAYDLLPYMMASNSRSVLLRTGIASTFVRTPEKLVLDGCALLRDSRWFPMAQLDVGTVSSDVMEVESALVIRFVLDGYGADVLRSVWWNTSSLRGLSLDTALQLEVGMARRDIEKHLLLGELSCE